MGFLDAFKALLWSRWWWEAAPARGSQDKSSRILPPSPARRDGARRS